MTYRITFSFVAFVVTLSSVMAHATPWDPDAADYSGRKGVTIYVSKLGSNLDGRSWATAYNTIQAALDAVPDADGGHRIIVRPDTYMEANITVPFPGAAGAYNLLIGDCDNRYGSGTKGRIVLDSGDPSAGFKSYDWWGNIRSNSQGWSKEHTAPTFSAIVWDRWILRNLYATGGDAGLFWDCTNRIEPFTIIVEDCTSIGRAFGGGVASCLSRPDEPITFRRCTLWALDWWGDTAGAYVRVENKAMPERPDVLFEDCTMVSPQCALKGGNFGFRTFMRIKTKGCRLVTLNFSQPAGTPTDGIVQSVEEGKYLHVDFEDCTLMGYKVFGVRVKKDTVKEIGYTTKGAVQAYVQFTQEVPKGMLRLGHWPSEVFDTIVPPGPPSSRPVPQNKVLAVENTCEVTPIVWKKRLCLMVCVRPVGEGKKEEFHISIRDVESGEELGTLGTGYSLASAIVEDDAICVFASRLESGKWNDVTLFKSQDLKNWEQKVVIAQEPNEHLFNSSVCRGPNGYVMAYESDDPTYAAFTVKFALSTDLENWAKAPDSIFGTNRYTACPTVRFVNGFYYLLYTEQRSPRWFFETFVARSSDLKTWYQSPMNPVLTPRQMDEGINNSDPDLVEFNGATYLYYATGDQRSWMNVKRTTYPGTMQTFLESFYPNEGIRDIGDLENYRARKEIDAKAKRLEWFNQARFGLFVHWGPFAVQGADPNASFDYFDMKKDVAARGQYVKYANQFNPTAFDAARWIEIAKAAGTKYLVFTSKHHDGYCMFNSALTDYDTMDTAPKRDYVAELVKAARAADMKIGFYYSMLDWHHPDYAANLPKFVSEYLFGQVRELCTNYGRIDCVWFDGEWDYPAATWRASELAAMIRQLQPDALINDRLGQGERGTSSLCDFYTREQPSEVNTTMAFERQQPHTWEACMTVGEYWQYSIKDTRLKSPKELVGILVDIASRGGNLLLNVGPAPDGQIPEPLVQRLLAMGEWLKTNGESIYGTSRSPFKTLPVGKCTTKDNRLYIHLDGRPTGPVSLPGLQNTIKRAWMVNDGAELAFDNGAKTVTLPDRLPADTITTIAVELDAIPVIN